MGAYGSPQLGVYANDNKKKKPKSPTPWSVIIIALLIIAGYQLYTNRLDISETNYKISTLLSKIEEQATASPLESISKEPLSIIDAKRPGILSNTMGTYFIEDKQVESQIKDLLLNTVNEAKAKSINVISVQASINDVKTSVTNLEARKTEKAYNRYKEKTIETYVATLNLLENYLANGNTTYENMATLYNDFINEGSKAYDIMKELFDENGILYTETIEEEGKHLRYQYVTAY